MLLYGLPGIVLLYSLQGTVLIYSLQGSPGARIRNAPQADIGTYTWSHHAEGDFKPVNQWL